MDGTIPFMSQSKPSPVKTDIVINLSPRKAFITLLSIVGIITLLHLIGQYVIFFMEPGALTSAIMSKFDMGIEVSIPTWYAQILLLTAGLLFAYIAYLKFLTKDKYRFYWAFLSLLFVYLSIDEGSGLHELLGMLDIANRLGIQSTYFAFAWVVPMIPVLLVVGVSLFRFWLKLPKRTRWYFALAAVIFVGGALGVEMLSADYRFFKAGEENFTYRGLFAIAEEGLEMIGVAVLIYALLDYAQSLKKRLVLGFSK